MGYYDYKPNERVCRKAVNLWAGMMHAPKFDQLGKSRQEQSAEVVHREALAQLLTDRITSGTTSDQIEVFSEEFYRVLTTEYPFRDLPLEEMKNIYGRPYKEDTIDYLRSEQWVRNAGTDYDPCHGLAIPGTKAGLPSQQFPIKTRMWIHDTHLTLSAGYGAQMIFYYPMEDGSWLVTSLNGSEEDVEKLKAVATRCPGLFTVERDEIPA